MKVIGHMWRSEDNHRESVLSFLCVGPGTEFKLSSLGARAFTCEAIFVVLVFIAVLILRFLGGEASAHALLHMRFCTCVCMHQYLPDHRLHPSSESLDRLSP